MKIQIKKRDVFIPEWNGNKKNEAPIEVHFNYLTAGERSEYIGIEPVRIRDGEPEIIVKQNGPGIAKKMITRIENLEVGDVLVDDARKLYSTVGVPQSLIQEIESFLSGASAQVDDVPLD